MTRDYVAAVTQIIREQIEWDIAGDFDFATVQRLNAQGWTIDFPTSLGNVLRVEDMRLSDAALRRAWEQAND